MSSNGNKLVTCSTGSTMDIMAYSHDINDKGFQIGTLIYLAFKGHFDKYLFNFLRLPGYAGKHGLFLSPGQFFSLQSLSAAHNIMTGNRETSDLG